MLNSIFPCASQSAQPEFVSKGSTCRYRVIATYLLRCNNSCMDGIGAVDRLAMAILSE